MHFDFLRYAKNLTQLTDLDLSYNQIGYEGAKVIGKNISSLSFDVVSSVNIILNNFTIRIGTTSNTILNENTNYSYSVSSSFQPFNLASIGTGWIEFTLGSQFYWNGTSNIVIESCFDNTAYNLNSTVRYSNSGFKSNLMAFRDNASGCTLPWNFYAEMRPNMRLKFN